MVYKSANLKSILFKKNTLSFLILFTYAINLSQQIGGKPVSSETAVICKQSTILSVIYTDPNLKISTFTLTHSNF